MPAMRPSSISGKVGKNGALTVQRHRRQQHGHRHRPSRRQDRQRLLERRQRRLRRSLASRAPQLKPFGGLRDELMPERRPGHCRPGVSNRTCHSRHPHRHAPPQRDLSPIDLSARADLHHRDHLRGVGGAGAADLPDASASISSASGNTCAPARRRSCAPPAPGGRSPDRPSSWAGRSAAALSRLPLPWRRFRLLRWAAGAAIVLAARRISAIRRPRRGVGAAAHLAASLAAIALAALMAMLGPISPAGARALREKPFPPSENARWLRIPCAGAAAKNTGRARTRPAGDTNDRRAAGGRVRANCRAGRRAYGSGQRACAGARTKSRST